MTEHFQFAQPEWLYALPLILCLIILRRRRGAEGSITYPTVRFIASLARAPQSLAGKIGALCFVLAAAAIAIALARPQHVEDKTFRTVNGIDIMIAFDLSYSMETPDMVLNRMPINRLV
ncbi:BatA domain-containing protein, partial [uncultured Akkermansia sp.]